MTVLLIVRALLLAALGQVEPMPPYGREQGPTPYTVSPPDILIIRCMHLLPKPEYRIQPQDVLTLPTCRTALRESLDLRLVVTDEGTVSPDGNFRTVQVGGLTLQEAETALRLYLARTQSVRRVSLSVGHFPGMAQVSGEHLLRPDGTISLGTYGTVYVDGMTVGQVKMVIEHHLREYTVDPQVSVDVLPYNRLPNTNNETWP
jgi:polysaccharide biosynthesis/export protein